MLIRARNLVAVALIGLVAGCAMSRYSGDGVLTKAKAPAWLCQDEYDVDLGAVDFSKTITMEFQVAGLPLEEYTVGFELVASSVGTSGERWIESRKPDPLIELKLDNERGEVVMHKRGHLSEWTWSSALGAAKKTFVYTRGESSEVRLNATTIQQRCEGVRADGGWGTYFTPRRNGRYRLMLIVEKPDSSSGVYRTNLHISGVVGCL